MRILFERSGGFMGQHVVGQVDTQTLSAEEADMLRQMVAQAHFFELPPSLRSATEASDQFQYRLTVEDNSRRHTVETTDMAAPDSLRPLLRRLTILARAQRTTDKSETDNE